MSLSKNLAKITSQVQKKYGQSMVSVASETIDRDIVVHPTGSLMIDLALGTADRAGIPEGRLMEIYGPESAGKTTVALLMIAARQQEEYQKQLEDPTYQKKVCVFVDAEHALDFRLAEEYGVDMNELIYINPETAEQAMDVLDLYIRSGEVAIALIDSVPSLVPASVEQASFEQQHMAVLARFMSGVCQKLSGPAYQNKTTVIFINQIREALGKFSPMGTPETTPGGRALKFYSTIRMSVRRGDTLKKDGEQIGHVLRIRVVKNKIAPPFKEATVGLVYGEGVDRADEMFQIALKAKIIKQGGAWYSYVNEDGEVISFRDQDMKFQGRDGMIEAIRTIPEFFGELEDIIRGVKVEADDMSEEEIEALKKAEKE